MKTSTVVTALAVSVGLGSAQISFSNVTKSFVCPASGGSFCAGNSLSTNIIIRCSGTVGTPGNCNDNLAGVPPVGVKAYAPCYQSLPTAGDAACSYNGTVYPDNAYPYPASFVTSRSSATMFSDPCTDDVACGVTSTSTANPSFTTCTTTTTTTCISIFSMLTTYLAVIAPPSSTPSSSSSAAPAAPAVLPLTGIAPTSLSTTTSCTTAPALNSSSASTSLTGIALTPLLTFTSLPLPWPIYPPGTAPSWLVSLPGLAPTTSSSPAPGIYTNSSTLAATITATANTTATTTSINTTVTITTANSTSIMTPTSGLPASVVIGSQTETIVATGTTTVPAGSVSTEKPTGSSRAARQRVEWVWLVAAIGPVMGFLL